MERGNRGIAATKRRMLRDGEADSLFVSFFPFIIKKETPPSAVPDQ